MKSQTVQLFVTCIIDTLYPDIGRAVVGVLNRAGVRVEFPSDQTCCGQPAFNAGMRAQAQEMAKHTIQVFESRPGPVVLPSGSCTAMIRHGYQELFTGDDKWLPRAQALGHRTFEFSQYLVDELGVTDLGAHYPGKIAYHSSCHLLRELRVSRQPRLLLQNVSGAELVDLPQAEECCGFGGVFSAEHSQISSAMLARKIGNIEGSGAPTVVSCDAGCLTHINGGLHRQGKPQRTLHIAEVLAKIP